MNPETWASSGVINDCCALIGINTYLDVRHILRVFGMCHNKNNPSNSDAAKRGRPHIIKIPSEEANHVPNFITKRIPTRKISFDKQNA